MGIKDLKGQRFGRLVVLSLSGQDSQSNALWLCQCDCGGQIVTRNRILRTGDATSCGCKRKEKTTKHGMSKTPTYMTWRAVKDRCFNPKITGYQNYGGRGITMCERWLDFECFLSDMGVRPEGCTLDRIDNSKGYFPDNCRWTTPKQQSRNRRDNLIVITEKGTMCLKDAAEAYGIRYTTLHERLKRGWSIDKALTTPTQKRSYPAHRNHE